MLQQCQVSFLLHKMQISMSILFLVLLPQIILVGAQWEEAPPPSNVPNFSNFTPSMIIIIVVFIGAFFFLVFFSIYLHRCTNSPDDDNIMPRVGSLRSRRASTTRGLGLDASVIETFPTFSYSEVKDHKIGNGALECAVCLNEFEDDETLRLIPKCDHVFHPDCIDVWLESHVTCPVCRADLVPKPGDEPVQMPVMAHAERSGSRNGEFVVQVDANERHQEPRMNRNLSFDYASRLRKSWSMRIFGLDKFRSHSTGHSLDKPRENLERFTLKLPTQVRNEVMHRAALNRAKSCAIVLPREGSLRSGYRRDTSNRNGRFYPDIEQWSDRKTKSVQWNFLTRGFSMGSPKMGVATDQESSTKGTERRTHVKMPSFNCLEPKAVDEVSLFSNVLMHD